MTTKITWLGHSAFRVETGGKIILVDPFLTGNPAAQVSADSLQADAIIVTHGHEDHVGDAASIAARTGAVVISNFEIVTWLSGRGAKKGHGMNLGGSFAFDFGSVKLTVAHHSSALPDGSNGGNPAGFVLKTHNDGNLYFAGDTALFSDMTLIGDEQPAVAVLPIGDNFTMGPEDSLRAIDFLRPRIVIPCHYNTWPLIAQDPNDWAARVTAKTKSRPVVLTVGESFEVSN
ncbi:MAG: metal-dependent hydrolase [Planctomycetaceae bacterium]|nr:metal-dependent hydrolase [Planctomycetaceae bacterium]